MIFFPRGVAASTLALAIALQSSTSLAFEWDGASKSTARFSVRGLGSPVAASPTGLTGPIALDGAYPWYVGLAGSNGSPTATTHVLAQQRVPLTSDQIPASQKTGSPVKRFAVAVVAVLAFAALVPWAAYQATR